MTLCIQISIIAEIYKFGYHENELESGVDSLQEGWSQDQLQESQVNNVQSKSENQNATRADPPDKSPEIAGVISATDVDSNNDLRPHYFDPIMKMDLMIDSGSQVTAFPPEPGDVEDSNVMLKAVNGTNIKTFGFKDITVKINRKPYSFRAIKADVEKPVIG